MSDVADNTAAIAADGDTNSANEIQNLSLSGDQLTITSGNTIDLSSLNNSGSDNQNLTGATLDGNNVLTIDIEDGNSASVDLTSLSVTGTDNQQITDFSFNNTNNNLTISIEDGNTQVVNLNDLDGGGGTDDQQITDFSFNNATNDLSITIEDGNSQTVSLAGLAGGGGTDDQDLVGASLSPANILQIDIENGASTTVDLSSLAGGGGTDDQTAAEVPYDPTASGLTATDTQAAIDEIAAGGSTDDQTAAEVPYDPTASGLTATDTQAAIDEIAAAGSTDDQTAAEVPYDPTASGLTATDTQAAIDEIAGAGGGNPNDELNTTFVINAGNLEITDAGGTLGVPLTSINTDNQDASQVSYDNTTSGLTATDTQAAIDEIAAVGSTDDQTAAEVPYDPTASGLTATDTQAALDEVVAGSSDDQTAAEVPYDPTASGLTATDTQAALDEVVAGSSDDQTAAEVPYDPTASGLTATDTQAALDEVVAGSSDDQTAAEVTYDPTASGLTATDTQAAIDEIAAAGSTDDQTAAEVPYDPTASGLTATDTQAALDEIVATVDGSETIIDATTSTVGVSGTGTTADPYILNEHTGTADHIFFADAGTGQPVVSANAGLRWDQAKRSGFGQLMIGLDNTGDQPNNDVVKTHIMEQGAGLVLPLQIQNKRQASGDAVGMLFSVDQLNGHGKGAIAYERKGPWGIGDFHFLQRTDTGENYPDLTHAVMTIENLGDVGIGITDPEEKLHINGNLRLEEQFIDETASAGNPGDVLTATATGTAWAAPGAANDNQNIQGSILTGETLTIGIENGNSQDVDLSAFATDADMATALASKENTANKSTDTALGTSDVLFPTQNAVKTYVDNNAGGHTGTSGSVFFADNTTGAPTEDNANFFWDVANSRLGVGTNTPQVALHVLNGQVRAGSFAGPNLGGSEANPTYRFDSTTKDDGMFQPAEDEIAFSTGGTEGLRIYDDQSVRIGPVNGADPNGTLEVSGSLAMPIGLDIFQLGANDFTTIVTTNGIIDLPDVSDAEGRIYIIKNNSGGNISTDINYFDSAGASTSTIAVGVVQLQSDGTNWQQIN
ncbi:MAG: beta strand repeat-containing protein [Flavobacteriaceae bacterium]